MPKKISGSFGSGAFSHTAMPGRSARLRGTAITPRPAATAPASAMRLEPTNIFS